jgi:tRNA pseudouridine38-40 synthase
MTPTMRTLKLALEYDGSNYCGWQVQGTEPTIQGVLEAALAKVLDAPVRVHGAGRTDARVHALGQVASFQTGSHIPCDALLRGLNSLLPRDVVVYEAQEREPDFHARYSAREKVYAYRILNRSIRSALRLRSVWHVPRPLNLDAVTAAAAYLRGTHDFTSFRAAGSEVKTSERTLREVNVVREGDEIVVYVAADGFLRHMVRNIVGTLVEVGWGMREPEEMRTILAARDRRLAGRTAPPQGLYLVRVLY